MSGGAPRFVEVGTRYGQPVWVDAHRVALVWACAQTSGYQSMVMFDGGGTFPIDDKSADEVMALVSAAREAKP